MADFFMSAPSAQAQTGNPQRMVGFGHANAVTGQKLGTS